MDEEIVATGLADIGDNTSVEVMECNESTFIVTTTDDEELVNLSQELSTVAQNESNSYVIITTDDSEIMNHGFYESALLQEAVLNSANILPSIQAPPPEQQLESVPSEIEELSKDDTPADNNVTEGKNHFINIGNFVTELKEAECYKTVEISKPELDVAKCSPKKRKFSGKQKAHSKPVNYVTPVQMPNGLMLFISESTANSGGGHVVAMATKADTVGKTGCQNVKDPPSLKEPTVATTVSKSSGPPRNTVSRCNTSQSLSKQNKVTKSKRSHDVCFLSNSAIKSVQLMDTNCTVTMYACELCEENNKGVQFCQFSILARHYLKTHQKQLVRKATVACKEEGCNFKSWKVDQLRHHLSSAHGYEMKIHKIVFSSMDEFQEWKQSEERRTGNQYVRASGSHPARQGDCTYIYYSCRRSGHYQPEDDTSTSSKKRTKSGACDKINGRCTSTITLTQLHDKQTIHCEYWPFHYGHGDQTRQRTLSKEEKKWMLQLIERGWNTDEILKALREAVIPGTTERMRKAVRQDLANIVRSQGRRSFERRDMDDATSIRLWIQELRNKGAVLISKTPHDTLSKSTEEPGHFLLMVMDDHQAQLAHHAENHVLQILNVSVPLARNYQLVCLTTISKWEAQGYLLAYALTDRCGSDTMRSILTAFQTKTGGIHPQLIISEEPDVVSLIWPTAGVSDVSEDTTTVIPALIPWWKVERQWTESAVKWIRDENQRFAVKKFLDLLLSESDPNKFAAILQFVTVMLRSDSALAQFAQYFADNWTNQVENWAKLHPVPSDCTPLIQLEKEVNLIAQRARHVRRLDKCIYTLDYISRHQPFNPVIEFRTGNTEDSSDHHEIEALRLKLSDDLKHLSQSVRSIDNLTALRQISKTVAETAVAAANSDSKCNA